MCSLVLSRVFFFFFFNWGVRFPQGSESVTTNRHIQTGLKKREKKRKTRREDEMRHVDNYKMVLNWGEVMFLLVCSHAFQDTLETEQ